MKIDKWRVIQHECKYNIKNPPSNFGLCSKTNSNCAYKNCHYILENIVPPLSSYGELEKTKGSGVSIGGNIVQGGNVSTMQIEVFKLRHSKEKPLSFQKMGDTLNISKKTAHKHYHNCLRNMGNARDIVGGVTKNGVGVTSGKRKGVTIRLHNDEIKIQIKNDLKKCQGTRHALKYCSYKLFKDDRIEIRYFDKTTLIKFKEDIVTKTEKEAEIKANERIKNFLYNRYGLNQYSQLKRHYGVIGTDFARKVRKDGLQVIIYDDLDNKIRQRLDFSHDVSEIDSEHVIYGRSDSEKTRDYLDSIIKKPHYKPHETKVIIDTILGVQHEYAENMKAHVKVIKEISINLIKDNLLKEETLKTLKLIQENVRK